jgi:nucleoside-diphosphate-sugar epimerase
LRYRNLARGRPSDGFIPDDVVVGDMTDASAVDDALAGCDGVVHAAALVDLRRAAARLVEDTNPRGVELVVGGAVRRGLPSIVYVSSLGAFFRPGGPPVSPEQPIMPGTTAYARSKAQAERFVRRLQEQGAPIRISYPCAIVGPNDPTLSAANHGVRAQVRDLGLITSSGIQVVDVRDVAMLHQRLLDLPAGPHRYAAAGEMLSWSDYFLLLDSLIGGRCSVGHRPCTLSSAFSVLSAPHRHSEDRTAQKGVASCNISLPATGCWRYSY